jgi:hypothetical protein
MRLPTRDRPRFADVTGPAGSELFDAVPTQERPPAANRSAAWLWLAARFLGALALLATGAVHLHEYDGLYSSVPTIGTLFLLNFIGATALGLCLLAPVERIGGRYGGALLVLIAVAGIGLAAVAFAFLTISQHTPLFGFQEPGYDPPGIAAAQAAEIATVVFLGAFLVGRLILKSPIRRW